MHIFPEGKIIQSGMLGANYFGTRSPERANEIGKLKWGVGKLIGMYALIWSLVLFKPPLRISPSRRAS